MGKVISVTKKSYTNFAADADIDFGKNVLTGADRRSIISYLQKKYDHDGNVHVAAVGNLNCYSLKSAVQDLASTYEIPPGETFPVTKMLNDSLTIEENMDRSSKVKDYFIKHPHIKKFAEVIVGSGRNLSVHAGGVVITDKKYPLNKYCALQRAKDGMYATMFTKDEIEELGLVKMDLLGVNALTQIEYTRYLINKKNGWCEDKTDYAETPDVFKFINKNQKHKNIFQFESPLGKKCMADLKIESIMDAANASGLIRVMGTAEGRELYKKYQINSEAVAKGMPNFWKEILAEEIVDKDNLRICEEVLAPTYGVLIYQEQLAQLIEKLSRGKYSFNDGNDVRKKLGLLVKKFGLVDKVQKDPVILKQWHKELMELLGKYVIPFVGKDGPDSKDPDVQDFLNFELRGTGKKKTLPIPEKGILNLFIVGSTYLFSVIHSVGYSVITYNQMYQKTYYPIEFWISALSLTEKHDEFIDSMSTECGIEILAPCVNKSDSDFTGESKKSIRYGLRSIMNMDKAAEDIIKARGKKKFVDMNDFLERTEKYRSVNKRVVENLIAANAFDHFGHPSLILAFLIKHDAKKFKETVIACSEKEKVLAEHKVLGVNISFVPQAVKEAKKHTGLNELVTNMAATCSIFVEKITPKNTKNNKPYLLVRGKCLKSGLKTNLFCWNAEAPLKKSGSYLLCIVKNEKDFHSIKM